MINISYQQKTEIVDLINNLTNIQDPIKKIKIYDIILRELDLFTMQSYFRYKKLANNCDTIQLQNIDSSSGTV